MGASAGQLEPPPPPPHAAGRLQPATGPVPPGQRLPEVQEVQEPPRRSCQEPPGRSCQGPYELLSWIPGVSLFVDDNGAGNVAKPATSSSGARTPTESMYSEELLASVSEAKFCRGPKSLCPCGKPSWNGKKGEYCSRACKEHRSSSRPRPTPPKTAVQCAMPDCVRPAMGGEFCSRACAAKATCSAQVTTGSPTEFAKIGDGEGSSSLQEPDFVSSAASTADSRDATRSGRRRGARHPVCQLEAEEDTGRLQVFTQMMGARLQVIAFSYEGSKQACDKVCQSEFLGNRYDMEHSIISVKAANEQDTTWRHFKSAEVAFLALKHWQRAGKLESLTSEEAFRKQEMGLGPEDPTYAGYGSAWAAMLGVLRQKFRRGSELAQRLLSTNEAFLLCRCSDIGIDQVWSDNACGDGENWLGMQLMLVRDELRKREGRWSHVIRLGLDVETGLAHSQLAAKTWRQATTAASGALQYAEVKLMVAD